ncbi:MAG: class II aldolase/adducin family protein [Solirubrobacteraceae bacterium]|nr:class II aldolase/adducin family protein [Patulibacter sp.]
MLRGLRGDGTLRAKRRALLGAGRALEREGLVVGTVGNLSFRHRRTMYITPSQTAYGDLGPRDLVAIDLETGQLLSPGVPSRELPLHLAIYRARPDVGGIAHTHSLHATAWSFSGKSLEPRIEDLDYYGIAPVRTTRPARAGSIELGQVAVEGLGADAAVLLGDHGVLTVGPTIDRALLVARVVERQAQIAWLVHHQDRRPVQQSVVTSRRGLHVMRGATH